MRFVFVSVLKHRNQFVSWTCPDVCAVLQKQKFLKHEAVFPDESNTFWNFFWLHTKTWFRSGTVVYVPKLSVASCLIPTWDKPKDGNKGTVTGSWVSCPTLPRQFGVAGAPQGSLLSPLLFPLYAFNSDPCRWGDMTPPSAAFLTSIDVNSHQKTTNSPAGRSAEEKLPWNDSTCKNSSLANESMTRSDWASRSNWLRMATICNCMLDVFSNQFRVAGAPQGSVLDPLLFTLFT